MSPFQPTRRPDLQTQDAAVAEMNRQAAEQDFIQQQQEEQRRMQQMQKKQASDAARAQKAALANAKRQGVKIAPDATGAETIQLHPDGQPVYEAGFVGEPQITDKGGAVAYRDARGQRYDVPFDAIRSEPDPTGETFYSFDVTGPDGQKQTMRQPAGTKPLFRVDPGTGSRIVDVTDPTTGSVQPRVVGVDPLVANKAAIEKRKNAAQLAQNERSGQAKLLQLELEQKDTLLEPVRQKLREAQDAADKLAREKSTYEQAADGFYAVTSLGDGVEPMRRKLDKPDEIAKADAWVKNRAATEKALMDAKAAHDPAAAEIQAMKERRAALAIETLKEDNRAQAEIQRMQEAAEKGTDVTQADWQTRVQSLANDERMRKLHTIADLEAAGDPLAPDVQRAAMPDAAASINRMMSGMLNNGVDLLNAGLGVGAKSTLERAIADSPTMTQRTGKPATTDEARKIAAKSLGITDPASVEVTPNPLGHLELRYGNDEFASYEPDRNRITIMQTAGGLHERAADLIANADKDGVPVYLSNTYPNKAEQPFTAAELRDLLVQGVDAVRSADSQDTAEAALAQAGLAPNDIRDMVRSGKLSVQDGRMMLDKFHGVEAVNYSRPAIEQELGRVLATSKTAKADWDAGNKAAVINRVYDKIASRATSGNVVVDRGVLEQGRQELLSQHVKEGAASQVGGALKELLVPMAGMWAAIPRTVLHEVTGGAFTTESQELSNQSWNDYQKRIIGFVDKMQNRDKVLSGVEKLKAWAKTANPDDMPPDDLAEELAGIVYNEYHALTDDAAKALNTSRDTFNVNRDPMLRAALQSYLKTANPAAFGQLTGLMMMDAQDRKTQAAMLAYVENPRVASAGDVIGRAKGLAIDLTPDQAGALIGISRVLARTEDPKAAQKLIAEAGKIMGLEGQEAAETLARVTADETDDPDSAWGLLKGGFSAGKQEVVIEAATMAAEAVLAWVTAGAATPEIIAERAARQGIKTGIRAAIRRQANAAFTKLADSSTAFARTSALLGKARQTVGTGLANMGEAFAKAGIKPATFGQPLTRANKVRNAVVQVGKNAAAAAPMEALEEGVAAIGEPDPNAASIGEQMLMGAAGGLVLTPMFAGAAAVGQAWKNRGAAAEWEARKTGYIDELNRRMESVPGFKPLTVADFDAWQGLQDNPAQAQARQTMLDAMRGHEAAVTEWFNANAGNPQAPLSPAVLAAQANVERAGKELELATSSAFMAMDELRGIPEAERPLYTAAAKAATGARDFTEAEAKALMAQGGNNAVVFQQAQAMPADVAGPPAQRAVSAPAVSTVAPGVYRLPAGVRVDVPPALLDSLVQKAPTMVDLLRQPANQTPAVQAVVAKTDAKKQATPKAPKGKKAKPATTPQATIPPEQMTPDEYRKATIASDIEIQSKEPRHVGYSKSETTDLHKRELADAIRKNRPVSAPAVDAYGIELPAGYVQEGNLYKPNATTPTPTKQDAGPLPVGAGNTTGTPAKQPANPTPAPVAPEPGKPSPRETAPTARQREPVTPSIETPIDNAPAPLPQDLDAKLAALTKGGSVSFSKAEKDTVNASWGEASPFNVPEAFKKGKTAKSARDLPMGSRIDDDTPVAKEEVLFIVEAIAEAEMQRRNTLAKRRLVVIGGHVANDGGAGYFWDTDTVAVNPQRLARMVWAEMLNAGKAPTRRLVAEQARGVITHEIVHAAQFEAARVAYSKIKGDKPAFEEWVKDYYEAIWNSLDSEQQQATIAAYGTILANAPEWHRGAEASRMLLETGTMERMSEAIIRHLENVLAVLKRWYDDVVNGKADNAIVADEIERVQAVLDAWNSGGTVKPDAKKKPAKPKAQTDSAVSQREDANQGLPLSQSDKSTVISAKIREAIQNGVPFVASPETLDALESAGLMPDGWVSIPNPNRAGIKDQFLVGPPTADVIQKYRIKNNLDVPPSQAIPPATTQTADVQDQTEAQGQRQTQEVLTPANPETAPAQGAVDGGSKLREYRDVYGKRWFIADSEWQSDKTKLRAFEDEAGTRRTFIVRDNIVTAESTGEKADLVRRILAAGYQLPAEQFRETESQKGWRQRWEQGWRPYGLNEDGQIVPAWEEVNGQLRLTDMVNFLWAKPPVQEPVSQPAKSSPEAKSAVSEAEQKAADAMRANLAGLFSAPAPQWQDADIPEDRVAGIMQTTKLVFEAGIRTPEAFAAFMERTFPGGKSRPYVSGIWQIMGGMKRELRTATIPDWRSIYAELDQASFRPPSVEGVPGPSSEQGAAPAASDVQEPPAESGPQAADPVRELILSADNRAKKAQAMKKLAEERGETLKQTQEFVESRLVQIADEVAREDWRTPQDRFEELVGIYDKQPLFSARTSTSMENQAYSTPAPMAFALRHMTGVTPQTSVYDATAGNGMLAIGSDLKNSVANEIDETRLEGLRRLGIGTITTQDATDPTGAFQNRPKAQTVHLNPPFGGIPNVNFDGYGIRKLEHIISLQALKEGMADNGTAAIILGATMNNQEQVKGAQWVFENYLYAHYNVVDNFEVSGDLYGNQGAKWPVRILVIAGKKAVPTRNQDLAPKTVDRLDTWPDVWARAERTRYEVERQRQTLGTDGQTTAPSGNPAGNTGTADTRPIPDSQRPAASTPSGSGVRGGNAGGQPRPGATGTGGSGLAAPGATEQPADAGTFVQPATGGRKPAASVGGRGGRRPTSAANAPSGSSQTGGATDASGQNPANAGSVTPRPERRKAAATATQVPYDPASNGSPFETLVPRGIGESLQTALAEIVANRGPIDQYVADRLDMSVEDLHKAMAAEQIDGVAMAIYQMETGGALIIGDETGIGKGRQAASLIRYAILQGKIPVFFTKDPKLFSDMWGDLKDIGTTVAGPNVSASDMSVRPLILGDSEKAQIKTPDNVVVLKPASNARQSTVFAAARQNGFASTGHNAIFSTYSQIRDPNARQEFLEWLAANDDVVVVLDEAHESAGDGETSMQAAFMMGGTVKRGKGSSKTEITKSGLLNGAGAMHPRGGVLYLSATFAKRPDNMPVYFRTDLRKGSDKFSQVVEAMDKGGVALQQAITEALAEAGQYTRRERDFTGVSYAMKQVTVRDEAELVRQVDAVTGVLSAIANFSKLIRAAVEDSTARTDSQSSMTDFASIVHNQVSQLLLAAKADAVVDEVVEAHKRGEKPIVALMNTMESFLSQYVDDMNIKPGQPMKLNWAALLEYALSRTLRASEKMPNGDTVIYTVDPAEHGLGMAYQRVLSAARAVNVAFPVSPIDYIIQKARAGGVEVGELTGRESGIDYTNFQTGEGTYRKFKRADKNTLVNTFNNGSLAGMLLNASGSTGLSIHAAAKFKDQKPRHMIIAQPALDINVFIQTLGRIKRTGIVLLGRYPDGSAYGARYSHLTLPLNSELRPAIMAARKMKSLNANTTGESDSAVKIEAEDLMNRFGNQVVAEYLSRNPELQDALNIEVEEREDGTVVAPKDIARKFTGRMALQPNKVQGEAYAEIISDYRRAIEQAKVTGDYDLEIIVHEDWDATRAASEQIVAGTDESSIFTSSVNVELWDMTDNRPTPSGADMLAEFTKENGSQQQLDARWQDFSKQVDERLDGLEQRLRQRLAEASGQLAGMSPDDPAFKGLEREVASLERNLSGVAVKKARWRDTQRRLDDIIDEAGRPVMIENAETQEMDHGMLTQIRFPDITGQLRIAPSAFKMTYLLNRPGGRIYPTLAQFKPDGYTQARSQYSLDDMTGDRGGRRERRTLLVGSPIRAYGATGGKGKVVRFKARDGSLVTGILMPRSWNISNLAEDPRKELADAGAVEKYMRDLGWTPGFVESGDSVRIHAANGGFRITAPSARRTGGEIFLDDQLREIVGDFIRNGQRMTARIDSISDVPRVAARVMQLTGKRFKGQDVARVRKANGVDENADMDSPARTAKPKSAVKAAATEAWNRYLEQGGSSVNQISRDQWLNVIDTEEGRSLSSAPAPTMPRDRVSIGKDKRGREIFVSYDATRRRLEVSREAKGGFDDAGAIEGFGPSGDGSWGMLMMAINPNMQNAGIGTQVLRSALQFTGRAPITIASDTVQSPEMRSALLAAGASFDGEKYTIAPMPRARAEAIVRNLTGKEQAGKLNPKERAALDEARARLEQDDGLDSGGNVPRQPAGPRNGPPTTHIMPDGYELTAPGMHMLASAPVRAYHGTPHKVDKFRLDKIGTGEGAQAYGWGLYFAESPKVAEMYAKQLQNKVDPRAAAERLWDHVVAERPGPNGTAYVAGGSFTKARFIKAFESGLLDAAFVTGTTAPDAYASNLYTVELLPDEDEFLDWDKPLSEQSEKVKAAIASAEWDGPKDRYENGKFIGDVENAFAYSKRRGEAMNGADLYAVIVSALRPKAGAGIAEMQKASQKLASLGIPGIRYLDQGSRGAGDGTRNYVIFDENLVRILEENGKPVAQDTFSLRVTPAQDAEYMAAVEAGDMAKAQRMVDEAAKAAGAGIPKPVSNAELLTAPVFWRLQHPNWALNPDFKSSNQNDSDQEENGLSVWSSLPELLENQSGGLADYARGEVEIVAIHGEQVGTGIDGEPVIRPTAEAARFRHPNLDDYLRSDTLYSAREMADNASELDSIDEFLEEPWKWTRVEELPMEFDPVTYDDAGNIIPPSRRFDLGPDIRGNINPESSRAAGGTQETFSLRVTPAQDAEYMAAVQAGDMEKAQRMVDEAANDAADTLEQHNALVEAAYLNAIRHGNLVEAKRMVDAASLMSNGFTATRRDDFTVARLNKAQLREVMEIASNQTSLIVTPAALYEDSEPIILARNGKPDSLRDGFWRVAQMVKGGYDGNIPVIEMTGPEALEFSDSIDDSGIDVRQEYVTVYDAAKVAIADPSGGVLTLEQRFPYASLSDIQLPTVLRDDAGNVIPLSQRFNPQSDSILYSAPAPKKPNRATQAMRDIIEALPPPHREVLRDLLVNGMSIADAATKHNISETAVGNILRRGEAHIRLMLDRAPTKPTVQVQDGIVKATDGRPDLAMSGNAAVAAVDQRRMTPEEVTHAEMQELATRLFDVAPAEAENLVVRWMDSGTTVLSTDGMPDSIKAIVAEAQARNAAEMMMTAAAKMLVARKTLEGGNSTQLARLIYLYRNTGTEQARALGMRRDPFDTPEERAAMYLSEALLTPPDAIKNELRRNPANRDRILAAWAKRADEIKAEMLAHGIDLDATFADHAEEQKLVEETIPEPVKPALARAPKKTRQLVKAIMQGLTPAEAIKAAGLTAKAAFRAYQEFRATLNQTGTEAAQAMRDQLLRSAPAPGADFAANLGLPDLTEAEWLDAVQNNKPLRTTPETEKLKQHREKAKKAGTLDLKNSNSTRKAIRAIEERKSNAFEKISEFWRASILSGPQTHVVNLVSGLTYGAYEASFKKLAAGVQGDIARMFGAKPDAASLADVPAMIAASLPSIKLAFLDGIAAWKSETRAFENYALQLRDDNGELFKEQFNPALKGTLGKVMRGISFRLMGAADEFVKSFFTRIEVAAQARQIARNEGKTGLELAQALQELMEPGSLAWERALGQAKKITFQTEIGSGSASIDAIDGLAQLISRTKKGDFGKPLKGLAHFTFPFVDTPTNIFKAGVTMSPVGGLLALVDMIRAYNRYRKGNAEEAAKIYNAARALDDLTNQIVAWGFILGLSHLVKPGDDEDETPYITGTIPWRSTSPGERELAYRTAPPQSIRIGDRWISYKRLDPFASALAFTVDAIKEFQSGKPIDEVWGRIALGIGRNMQDKTFLQGISDVVNAVQDPERFGTKWVTNIATGFIPNLIRQPIRTADEVFRETDLPNDLGFWDALGRRMGYGIYPQGAMPSITVWGEPARKDTGTGGPNTDWMLRLLSPADMRAANVDMLDVALLRYNATHQDGDPKALFGVTAPSRELQRTIGGQVIKISLDDAEYEDFITKAGKAARQAIGNTYDGRDLTEADVDRIKDILSRAHKTFLNAAFVQAVQKRGGLNALANTSK